MQVIGFSDKATWLIPGTEGKWVTVNDGSELDAPVNALRASHPQGPTSLHAAFNAIKMLEPKPDNIFLLTDGLPTMGEVMPTRARRQRRRSASTTSIARSGSCPSACRSTCILFAMEGDPQAAPAYWLLVDPHGRLDAGALGGLAMKRRREFEIFSMSFLDAICCGFGAMILLFLVIRTGEPARLEQAERDLDGLIAQYEQELNEIVGETERVRREEVTTTDELRSRQRRASRTCKPSSSESARKCSPSRTRRSRPSRTASRRRSRR